MNREDNCVCGDVLVLELHKAIFLRCLGVMVAGFVDILDVAELSERLSDLPYGRAGVQVADDDGDASGAGPFTPSFSTVTSTTAISAAATGTTTVAPSASPPVAVTVAVAVA